MADETVTQEVRGLRAKEPWVRYDSIVIGPNLPNVPGWFPNFGTFAANDEVRFNDGSRTEGTAGAEYCNQSGDTEDWAQDIYRTAYEFHAPFGFAEAEQSSFDAAFGPTFWLQEAPRRMVATVTLADADQMLKTPPLFVPANVGVEGFSNGGLASTFVVPGHVGKADLRAGWLWVKPLQVPAKGKIVVTMRLGKPIRQFLQAVGAFAPGTKLVPMSVIAGDVTLSQIVPYPNWYFIRVSHWGPRYLQLRGARSS